MDVVKTSAARLPAHSDNAVKLKKKRRNLFAVFVCLFLLSAHLYIYRQASQPYLATVDIVLSADANQTRLELQLLQLLTAEDAGCKVCTQTLLVGTRCYCHLEQDAVHAWKDGSKLVCLDLLTSGEEVLDLSGHGAGQSLSEQSSCRVLSFGVDNDFSFDLGMQDLGCTVHAFDPTMNRADFHRSPRVSFHRAGLATHTTADFSKSIDRYGNYSDVAVEKSDASVKISDASVETPTLPLVTLETAAALAGWHSGVIDYVKLDIESSEWSVLWQQTEFFSHAQKSPSAPLTTLRRVRQLQIELHLMQWRPALEVPYSKWFEHKSVARFVLALTRLRHLGFRLVRARPYYYCKKLPGGGCLGYLYDTHWVNFNLV